MTTNADTAPVVCMGEALIDFIATDVGVSIGQATTFARAPGGAPANVAVGLARLGAPSAFVGKVGDDPFGRYLASVLADAGVDVSHLRFHPSARTGLAFVALDSQHRPDFLFYRHPSADQLITPAEVLEVSRGARALHAGSVTLSSEPAASATRAAMQAARDAGRLVSFDPNLRPDIWPSPDQMRQAVLAAFPLADVVKCSQEELTFLTGHADPNSGVAMIADLGPRIVVVTRGAAGAWGYASDQFVEVEGFAVQTVDTTGAGDGFMAGLLVGLLALLPPGETADRLDPQQLRDVLRLSNATGALTATRLGAMPALPTHADVEAFLVERGYLAIGRLLSGGMSPI
jgi:fructokinase